MSRKPYKRKKAGCTHVEQMTYEVQWYRKHGKHQDRVQLDDLGHEHVVCDFIWNKRNPYRRESVRDQLANFVAYRVTGISAR